MDNEYSSKPLKEPIIDYEVESDMLYVTLRSFKLVHRTVCVDDNLVVDYDDEKNVVGYEIINPWRLLKRGAKIDNSRTKLSVNQNGCLFVHGGGRPRAVKKK